MTDTDDTPRQHLRRWLRRQRMTGGVLAARLGYNPAHVYHILGGSRPLTPTFYGRFLAEFGLTATAEAFPHLGLHTDAETDAPCTASSVPRP